MPPSPTRHRVAVALALVGMALAAVTFRVDLRLAADAGYTSFCNLGGPVDCDTVLGSRWGHLFEVPVPVWAMLGFGAGALLALPGALGAAAGGMADLLLLGVVSGALGYALVLLGIAAVALRRACLLCLSLDAVILAWFVVVIPLVGRFAGAGGFFRRRTTARLAVVTGLLVTMIGGTMAALRTPAPVESAVEVQERDPRFYEAYLGFPTVPAGDALGVDRPFKGGEHAPTTIVEFSDFQCPACAQAFLDLRDLVRSRHDVRIVFRHFPLDDSCNDQMPRALHPDACLAATAAECAQRQGRFWEYHDELFTNQHSLDRESLFRHGRAVGLDIPAFRACLDDPATRDRIRADVADGARLGVTSTPTLFINGRKVDGALERSYYDYALVLSQPEGAEAPGASRQR